MDPNYNSDNGDAAIFSQTNIAVWVLTSASGAFLAVRLWCRHRFSKLWWDDALLTLSWVILLISASLLSRTITAGYATDEQKIEFMLYQNTETAMTTLATAWSKVAFAITLSRIIRNRFLKYFLWFVMVTANLILVPGMISIWVPACTDPRRIYRPAYPACMNHIYLQYLGGTTIVYGGVIDVLLALFPWFVIKNLLLETREKIGLTFAMSLGLITGTIVIFRAFFQLKKTDNNYHFLVFMSIFNFLEPSVTIIAQAIPMFRVLVVNVKKSSNALRISSPTDQANSNALSRRMRSWDKQPDEELANMHIGPGGHVVHISAGSGGTGGSDSGDDKPYYTRHH